MDKTDIGKIKCKICGESFTVLATHIIRRHKISSAEYLKRFPGAKLSSDEHRKKLSKSSKSRFLKDPTLRKKVASRTFDFISNKKLTPLLRRDYASAKACLKISLWKPCIILYGSIIEAILIEMLKEKKTFVDALELARKKKIISEQDYHKIHIVRDLRNYVHLHKELKEKKDINEYWARTFSDICESIIKRFKK